MLDLETQLHRYAEHLETRIPDITVDEILGGSGRPAVLAPVARRRRPLFVVVVAAAAALVLIGGMALLTRIIGAVVPPVVTTPEPLTIQASEWPLGMILAGDSGIAVVPFDSPDEPILLQSDDRYRGIAWAISDHRGGLIFAHRNTPPPWAPGSVMWLRAGAITPEVLIEPRIEHHVPVLGMATSAEGHALLVYIDLIPAQTGPHRHVSSKIMVADLDDRGPHRRVGAFAGLGDHLVRTGGGVVVVLDDGFKALLELGPGDWLRDPVSCYPVTVLSVDDGRSIPTAIECVPADRVWEVSHDGRTLAVFDAGPPPTVMVIDLATGEVVEEAIIDADPGESLGVTSSPGGWLVRLITGSEVRLVDLDGTERGRSEWAWAVGYPVTYHHPLLLAQTIGLGSGSGEVPCRPTTAELEDQDLPEPVAATRRLLFDLAASCDYEGLASMAIDHDTLLFLGLCCWMPSDEHNPLLEEYVVSYWISAGLLEPHAAGVRSREPLASLAALLRTRPAHVDDIAHWPAYVGPPQEYPDPNPEPGGCVWVWPALYVGAEGDPGDGAVWSEHYDYRIGIAADGTWRFFMAHFYERGVSPRPPPCGDT